MENGVMQVVERGTRAGLPFLALPRSRSSSCGDGAESTGGTARRAALEVGDLPLLRGHPRCD
jgi:hypothetical protein